MEKAKRQRHSPKRDHIFAVLRERIISGHYAASGRLPPEPLLSKDFGVARETLRDALALLDDAGFISRSPRSGTLLKAAEKQGGERKIHFLLPCPDYMLKLGESSLHSTLAQFSGLLKEARCNDYQAVMLPVSSSNNPEEMDLGQLQPLNSESMVYIFSALWYSKIFHHIEKRRCRVVAAFGQSRNDEAILKYVNEWHLICFDIEKRFFQVAQELASRGCRNIAVATQYVIADDIDLTYRGFKAGVLSAGLEFSPLNVLNFSGEFPNIQKPLRKLWERIGFDGLVISAPFDVLPQGVSLQNFLGLPETIEILLSEDLAFNEKMSQPLGFFSLDHEAMGRQAARLLMADEFCPGLSRVYTKYVPPGRRNMQ